MADSDIRRARRPIAIVRRPIYALFLPVAVTCFLGALVTDLAYQGSGGTLLWVNFSSWLIAAGLVFAAIALVILLIDAVRRAASWLAVGLLLVIWVIEFINSLVHARDGWTAVVPTGLMLSLISAALILICGWLASSARYAAEGGWA